MSLVLRLFGLARSLHHGALPRLEASLRSSAQKGSKASFRVPFYTPPNHATTIFCHGKISVAGSGPDSKAKKKAPPWWVPYFGYELSFMDF